MGIYPDCFPNDFEECILPKDAGYTAIEGYRIANYGVKDPRSYLSSFEERILEHSCDQRPLDPDNAESYSTSLFDTKDYPNHLLKLFMREHPAAELIHGQTDPSCGPSKMGTKNFKNKRDSKTYHHISWWIYKNARPYDFFEKEM